MRRLPIILAFILFVVIYGYSIVLPPNQHTAWTLFFTAFAVFVAVFVGSSLLNTYRPVAGYETSSAAFEREQESMRKPGRFIWDWHRLPLAIGILHLILCVALASVAAPGKLTQVRGEWVIVGSGNEIFQILTPGEADRIRGLYLRCGMAAMMVFVWGGWPVRRQSDAGELCHNSEAV